MKLNEGKMKKALLMLLATACTMILQAQPTIIASDGFENTTTFFTRTGGAFFTGNSAITARPASSPFYSEGTYAVGIINGPLTLTSQVLDLTGYSNLSAQFRVAAFSLNSTNGMDTTDNVQLLISTDSGTTFNSYVYIGGNNNCSWSYVGGTGTATTSYPTAVILYPAGGGNRTSDGYSTVSLNNIPAQSGVVIRLSARNNDTNERWVIDDFRLEGTPITLPVELTSFTAMLDPQNHPRLNWITQSESNVRGFYVLRGIDDTASNAEQISPLIPATNTSQMQCYEFTDASLEAGGSYRYWLQHSDLDGTDGFHGPVTINYSLETGHQPALATLTALNAVYPNPFNPVLFIPYTLAEGGDVSIDIFNSRGQIVRQFQLANQAAGSHKITWDGTDAYGYNCSTGIYHIRLSVNRVSFLRKAVLIK